MAAVANRTDLDREDFFGLFDLGRRLDFVWRLDLERGLKVFPLPLRESLNLGEAFLPFCLEAFLPFKAEASCENADLPKDCVTEVGDGGATTGGSRSIKLLGGEAKAGDGWDAKVTRGWGAGDGACGAATRGLWGCRATVEA